MLSQIALRWTAEELFRGGKVYFWTFTVVQQMPAWWVPGSWNHFQRAMQNYLGKFKGVRVFEWHVDHGLHVHALVNRRLPYHVLKRIGAKYGFGLQWVRVADKNAAAYIGKYIEKDHGKLWGGARQWARFGGEKFGTRVKDIKFESARADYIRSRVRELKPFTTPFRALTQAKCEYDNRVLMRLLSEGVIDEF